MRQEAADELQHEEANPDVYKPEDGHEFTPAMPGMSIGFGCLKCGKSKVWHINKGSTA